MTRAGWTFALSLAVLAGPLTSPTLAQGRDGRLFDPGVTMTERAEGASQKLDLMAPFLGQWDVALEIDRGTQEPLRSKGTAHVTYMNRGHSLMERSRFGGFEEGDAPIANISFLSYAKSSQKWSVGEASSFTEASAVYSGDFAEGALVVYRAFRPFGGPVLMLQRRTYRSIGDDGFEMRQEISQDMGATWTPNVLRRYTRRDPEPGFMAPSDDYGAPAPGRAAEAAQFDFLVGEYDASHWRVLPSGQEIRYKTNATAVFILDGNAIMEFDHFDTDPTLPDAATSIVRIYNRAMRQWETLFLPNRSGFVLHFGGVAEGDQIVLHPFGTHTAAGRINQWIFYGVEPDAYRWKGLLSTDRGESFSPNWTIEFTRKKPANDEAADEPAAEPSSEG